MRGVRCPPRYDLPELTLRQSFSLLVGGVLATFGGAWLIGLWAVGVCLVLLGFGVTAYALLRDDGTGPNAESVQSHQIPGFARPAFSEEQSIDRVFDQQRTMP